LSPETEWCLQALVEFVYSAAQGVLYTVLFYGMVGFEWKADKFLYFTFFLVACFVYITLYGMMLIACTPSYILASVLVSFSIMQWNIFAGFLISRPVGTSTSSVLTALPLGTFQVPSL
jgi:hypothetical protein